MEATWKPTITETDQPLYLAIVRVIADDIASGVLSQDYRMPTHRELADSLGVAIGTITRAYAEAERRGHIRSEGRRGTFVGEARTNRAVLAQIANRPRYGIDLSKNHPSHALDPDLGSALRELARGRDCQALLEYPPAAGLTKHRESGARWFGRLGVAADPESVFVTSGAQHALAVILSAETNRGDVLATERFTYPGVKALAELLNLQMLGLSYDEDGVLPDSFETACRQRRVRVFYCNPTLQNPTNCIWPRKRREEIAQIAGRYGVTIVEDEIMRPMVETHPGYVSEFLPEQSYLVLSASKAVAAGLRVGFVLASGASRQRMVEGLNACSLGASALGAELFTHWLDNGEADRLIVRRRVDAAQRQKLAAKILDGLTYVTHPSSYHVWLQLAPGWNGMRFAMEAQLRGVVVSPAEAFAADSRASMNWVRLSVIVPPTMELLENSLTIVAGILRGSATRAMATV